MNFYYAGDCIFSESKFTSWAHYRNTSKFPPTTVKGYDYSNTTDILSKLTSNIYGLKVQTQLMNAPIHIYVLNSLQYLTFNRHN